MTHLFLINDLEANGYGIPELTPDQIFTLNQGEPARWGIARWCRRAQGLAKAILVWNGKMHVPMASEGGHCDYAARNPLEIELLQCLRHKLNGRVSFERVVSGPGLTNIYTFLRDEKDMEEPAVAAAANGR